METFFSSAIRSKMASRSKAATLLTKTESNCPILPGLSDDVAKYCLALVPRCHFPVMSTVCKRWRWFIQSKEFITVRKEAGKLQEWVYILTGDAEGKVNHWKVLGCMGGKSLLLSPMPGPLKYGFGVVALDGNLFVMAGYSLDDGIQCVSTDVYQYDSRLNRWFMVASMSVARYDFACAEVDGLIYVAGGHGADGNCLSSVEVYDPDKNLWTPITNLRCPRWGCFSWGFEGKLYVMGGRSSFAIGHSRSVDIYDPHCDTWHVTKNGCVMATTRAVVGERLFCIEWKEQRKLAIFDPADRSWRKVSVPLAGSSKIGFRLGKLTGKLLLFSAEEVPGYTTLMYDPDASVGSEWQTSELNPTGLCLCSLTIAA